MTKKVNKLDFALFDTVTERAIASPRLRMNYDLRTQAFEDGWSDLSQRMLNALEPGTVIPVHRHNETSETVICVRGKVCEILFDDSGRETKRIILEYGSPLCAMQVPRGIYHTCRSLASGSIIFEAKDRPYDPALTEDLL